MLAALVAAALAIALCIAPVAGLGGAAIARTDDTMQSNLSDLTSGDLPGVSTITDVNGTPMAWIFKQRRYDVPSADIAQYAKDALVSTEDRRFYEHEGVDMQGFARAMVTNVLAGGVEQGASTINQQYVKNYLWLIDAENEEEANAATEQSIPRKLREMRMASDLDKTLDKDEILTRYLNLVSFGNHAFGIEAAALTYFGIPARELDPAQAALLVGILQSVEGLNPYTNPEGALQRRNTVLANMAAEGYLDRAEADRMASTPLGILDAPNTLPEGCITAGDKGFMCDYALRYLADKGLDLETIQSGSYTITTTLDPAVQQVANNAVRNNVSPYTPGVAEVMNIIRPGADSRDILAMASSRFYGLDLDQSQTILPQPASLVGAGAGSVFKIFTAAAALEQGYGLDSMLNTPERSVVYGMGDGGAANCPSGAYCVENAGSYAPRMSLQDALAQSPNTTFVELIQKTGVAPVVDTAVRLGLRSYTDENSFGDGRSIAQAAKDENMGAFTLGPLPVNALELSNVATLPILLWPGMKIGQLAFFRLSSSAENPYGSATHGSHYQGQRGPTASRSWLNFSRADVGVTDAGALGEKTGQHLREEFGYGRGVGEDTDMSGRIGAVFGELAVQIVHLAHDQPRMLQQLVPGRRQLHPAAVAVEQAAVELGFQRLDACTGGCR